MCGLITVKSLKLTILIEFLCNQSYSFAKFCSLIIGNSSKDEKLGIIDNNFLEFYKYRFIYIIVIKYESIIFFKKYINYILKSCIYIKWFYARMTNFFSFLINNRHVFFIYQFGYSFWSKIDNWKKLMQFLLTKIVICIRYKYIIVISCSRNRIKFLKSLEKILENT